MPPPPLGAWPPNISIASAPSTVGMILDELAQADVHALLVAFGDEDQIHRQLADAPP